MPSSRSAAPKNQADADVFTHALLKAGHETVADPAEADAILINTCGFIQSAKEEAIENILLACQYKQQNPDLKVIVTGCLAERYKSQIASEMPEVDAVVGIGSNAALPAILERVCHAGRRPHRELRPQDRPAAWRGSDCFDPAALCLLKNCRGLFQPLPLLCDPADPRPLRSRPLEDCVAEARWLAGEGVKELIVVAQDPTAYGEDWGKPGAVCDLLDALNAVEGIRWIRVLYAYPERITDEFIAAMQRNEKVLPYLDLPIQHCNDRVLAAMGRRGDRHTIEDAIARLRAALPGLTLRTDADRRLPPARPRRSTPSSAILCARCGLTGSAALPTRRRKTPPAAKMDGQIDEETKQRRADHIMEIQAEISAAAEQAKVGQTLACICDGVDDETGMYLLRTAADCPEIDGNVLTPADTPLVPGEFYRVTITDADTYDLYGYIEREDGE